MCSLASAFPVRILVSCGSRLASNSSMATLASNPSRWPRCGRDTAVSSWKPHAGSAGSTASAVSPARLAGGLRLGGNRVTAQPLDLFAALVHPHPLGVPELWLMLGVARHVGLCRVVDRGDVIHLVLGRWPGPGKQPVPARGRLGPRPQRGQMPGSDRGELEHPRDVDHPRARAKGMGKRGARRACSCLSGDFGAPKVTCTRSRVPEQRRAQASAQAGGVHFQVQVGEMPVFPSRQAEPVPPAWLACVVACQPRLGRVLGPAALPSSQRTAGTT